MSKGWTTFGVPEERAEFKDGIEKRTVIEIEQGEGVVVDAIDTIARRFHERYEQLAPDHGYETRHNTRVAYADLPPELTGLVNDVVRHLIDEDTIVIGERALRGDAE